jgi:hypothetical protein
MPERRVVAFLDMLGFKNKIEAVPLDELSAQYEQIVAQARAYVRPQVRAAGLPSLFPNRPPHVPWCDQHIFSDSIILAAREDTDEACLELLLYAWRLTQFFIAVGMPLRGGVAYDEMYSNPNSRVFLGKALTIAYKKEGIQDWAGIAIDESVKNRYRDLFSHIEEPENILSVIFKRYPVPLKNGTTLEAHTVNWRYNYIVERGTRSLFPPSADPDAQRKIDNTLHYARSTIQQGLVYCQDEARNPIELRAFFVGAREPPFPHGDDL